MPLDYPDNIHGVSTKTRGGVWRKRYSPEEQLQMLGGSQAELEFFTKLFCDVHPEFSVTRAASGDPCDWVKSKGRLDNARVTRHLLGDRVPGRPPQWVAPWPTRYSRWIALDVDLHGDDLEDYQRRYDRALGTMIKLGFPRQSLLITNTPSGGVHLRGFFRSPMPVLDVAQLFGLIGVVNAPGQIEIYPQKEHGLRLPFGKLPDRPFDPEEWIQFVRRFQKGEVYTPKWRDVWDRAASIFEKRSLPSGSEPEPPLPCRLTLNSMCGSPKASTRRGEGPVRENPDQTPQVQRPTSRAEANRMIKEGIPTPGTRLAVTKHVAWHLIKVRGYSGAKATEYLNDWVYTTGKGISKDVDEDLRRGARDVAKQNADIVKWMMRTKSDGGNAAKLRLYPEEVARIVQLVNHLSGSFEDEVAFACRALEFAKAYGEATAEGWQAAMAAKRVFRSWPRCKGKRYKPLLDAVVRCGVMQLVRNEKRSTNGTGRARTYLVSVSPKIDEQSRNRSEDPFDIDAAVAYAVSLARAASERRDVESDTYRNVSPEKLRRLRNRPTNSKRGDGSVLFDAEIKSNTPHPLEEMLERILHPVSSDIKYGPEEPTIRRPRSDLHCEEVRQEIREEMRRSAIDAGALPVNNL